MNRRRRFHLAFSLVLLSLLFGHLPAGADAGCSCKCVRVDMWRAGWFVVDIPESCVDTLCTVQVSQNLGYLGVFGPGFLPFPVTYAQDLNDNWISGPTINLGGMHFEGGQGTNGDEVSDVVMTISGRPIPLVGMVFAPTEPPPATVAVPLTQTNSLDSQPRYVYVTPSQTQSMSNWTQVSEAPSLTLTIYDDTEYESQPGRQWTIELDFSPSFEAEGSEVVLFICPG